MSEECISPLHHARFLRAAALDPLTHRPPAPLLAAIQFTRTVLNQAALETLLPAARTLKLKSLLFLSSNLTPECCPLLVTAFGRPTASLALPASEWW